MPTVLDLVGLPVPAGLDGVSLLPMVAHESVAAAAASAARRRMPRARRGRSRTRCPYAETYYPRFHYSWSELFAVETGRWKFVRAPRPELYDLRADPQELPRRVRTSTRASPRPWPRTSTRAAC